MDKKATIYNDYEQEAIMQANDVYNNYKRGKTLRTENYLSIVCDNDDNYYLISAATDNLITVNPLVSHDYKENIELWNKRDYLTTDVISEQYFSLNEKGDLIFDIDHRGFLNMIELSEIFTQDKQSFIKNTNIPINNVNNAYNVDFFSSAIMIIEEQGQWNDEISLQLVDGKIYPYEVNSGGGFSFFINTKTSQEYSLMNLITLEHNSDNKDTITSFGYVNDKVKYLIYGDNRLISKR